ncbi:unnamed protein product [Hermetia illucens]|uniref:Uncharacterized protein n=2 Tax=Hermetia illucens TaxID=343691 RepID=A0A7R8YRF2_HERIL|nr:unnamed protein product [Hermetia illucens]
MTVERLRGNVREVLNGVISLHIDILVMEANVSQLIEEVREINADLFETNRLDTLIRLLKDFNGPVICHEWPYPLLVEGNVDEADIAQTGDTGHET